MTMALAGSLAVVACGPALASKRMALLIGNAAYKNVPSLRNPVNDARAVKEALEKIGFQTTLVTDVDEKRFRKALKDFADSARDADAVLFYYAGHGVEERQVGYLLPTDVELDDLRSIELSQVPSIDLVQTAIGGLHGPKILIVDACREDPNSRDVTVGEVQVRNVAVRSVNGYGDSRKAGDNTREDGSLIVFSTASKAVAYDGSGSQGPFASSLIRHLAEPGLSASDLFHKVNADVLAETNNQQRTSFYDSLSTGYKLNIGSMDDEVAWGKLKDASDPKLFDDFIRRFPDSPRAPLAAWKRDTILELTRQREDERAVAAEASAWDDASKADSLDGYASYLAAYPNAPHSAEATARRDRLSAAAAEAAAWRQADGARTSEGYEKFAAAYPKSAHRDEALRLAAESRAAAEETAAWSAANRDRTAEGFDKFAARYPESLHRDEARRLAGELRAAAAEAVAWAAASKDKTPDALENFARAFPASAHAGEAQRLAGEMRAVAAEAAAWAAALKDKSETEFSSFAEVFPNSPHAADALRRRDALREAAAEAAAWSAAVKDNSPTEFEQFAAVFPNSSHQREALRRRDELRVAALSAQEKLAWSSASEANSVDAYYAFIDQFPRSAHVADARRRIDDAKAAESAKASAEARAEICRREGETLAGKVAAHADPLELQALLSVSTCAAQRPAIEQALAEAKKVKAAAACEADRATLAQAGSDRVAVQTGLVGMTCDAARQEAKTVLAKLEAQDSRAKADAEAKAVAQRACDAAANTLDGVDLADPAARDRILAARDKSGCADAGFVASAGEKLAEATARVRSAQEALKQVGCYSAAVTGLFDANTRTALSAYLKQDGAAEPVSMRISPELIEKIRLHGEGAVCGAAIAKTTPADATAVAKATGGEIETPKATVAPVAPSRPLVHAPKPRISARTRPEETERERPPARRPAPEREAQRAAPERARPSARPVASAPPAARPAASGPSIMILPN